MAKWGTFVAVGNPAKNGLSPFAVYVGQNKKDYVFLDTVHAHNAKEAINQIAKEYNIKLPFTLKAVKQSATQKFKAIPKTINPIKYWILDPKGNVHLTITKGGREKAEKIAESLGKGFSVVGFGLDENERSPYAIKNNSLLTKDYNYSIIIDGKEKLGIIEARSERIARQKILNLFPNSHIVSIWQPPLKGFK